MTLHPRNELSAYERGKLNDLIAERKKTRPNDLETQQLRDLEDDERDDCHRKDARGF